MSGATRGRTCIIMPLAHESVMLTCSAARTSSALPIYTQPLNNLTDCCMLLKLKDMHVAGIQIRRSQRLQTYRQQLGPGWQEKNIFFGQKQNRGEESSIVAVTSEARRKVKLPYSCASAVVRFMRARVCPTQFRAPSPNGMKRLTPLPSSLAPGEYSASSCMHNRKAHCLHLGFRV